MSASWVAAGVALLIFDYQDGLAAYVAQGCFGAAVGAADFRRWVEQMSKSRMWIVRHFRGRFGNAMVSAGVIAKLLIGGLLVAWGALWAVHYLAELARWLPLPSELS